MWTERCIQLVAGAIGLLTIRLVWWYWRHERHSSLRDEKARRNAFIWFPWLSVALTLVVLWFFGPTVLRVLRLPPRLPADSSWDRERHDVSVDPFRGEGRYIRWTVDEPASAIEPRIARWVSERGRWWLETPSLRDGEATCEQSLPQAHWILVAGTPLPELGAPGVSRCLRGRPTDFWYGIVSRVTAKTPQSCTVELWLTAMQDM